MTFLDLLKLLNVCFNFFLGGRETPHTQLQLQEEFFIDSVLALHDLWFV